MDFPLTAFLNFSTLEWVLFIILVVPTVYVMLAGAPFVPTKMDQVDRMLKAAKLKTGMKIYDLGSGDGRLVYKAAKDYQADAVGFEFSPFVWLWSRFLKLIFWRSSAQVKFANFWKQDLSDADVIVCYLLPETMKKMEERLWSQLKPGALIISHAFSIKDREPFKKLPRLPEKRLGPIWIYKKTEPKAAAKSKGGKTPKLKRTTAKK